MQIDIDADPLYELGWKNALRLDVSVLAIHCGLARCLAKIRSRTIYLGTATNVYTLLKLLPIARVSQLIIRYTMLI